MIFFFVYYIGLNVLICNMILMIKKCSIMFFINEKMKVLGIGILVFFFDIILKCCNIVVKRIKINIFKFY